MGCGCSLGGGRVVSGAWEIPDDDGENELSLKNTEIHIQKPEGWVSNTDLQENGVNSPDVVTDPEKSFVLDGETLYRYADVRKYYHLGSKIGEGTYASVMKCTEQFTEKKYAVKQVNLALLNKQERKDLSRELEILSKMRNKYIVRLQEVFEHKNVVYMIQELLTGGELFEKILERKRFSEPEAKNVLNGIGSALAYCHSKGVVHRDIKPENVLLIGKEDSSAVKLIDFGFAHYLPEDRNLKLLCGTPGYVAPEMLKDDGYREQVDIWALGVIMYIMLAGFPPFNIDDDQPGGRERLFEQIKKANYTFPSPYWDSVSEEAIDLISNLLEADPTKRLTAQQALDHEWMHSVRQIEFDARRMWKSAIRKVIVTNRFSIPVLKRMQNFAERDRGEDPTLRGNDLSELRKAIIQGQKASPSVSMIEEDNAVTELEPIVTMPLGTQITSPKTTESDQSFNRKRSIFEVAPDVRKLQQQYRKVGNTWSSDNGKMAEVVETALDFNKKTSNLTSGAYMEKRPESPGFNLR
mmetsp:Transcript_27737/g.36092  ORF Transcript_27737/g.36092 Transcript_27737/m.36092 type:complete len:523 (-) Transcript_27737:190-1758(-)